MIQSSKAREAPCLVDSGEKLIAAEGQTKLTHSFWWQETMK